MVKAKRTALTIAVLLVSSVSGILHAQEPVFDGYNMNLSLELSSIDQAGPPRVIEDHVLLTYQSSRPVRYVGVAFAHEGYSEVHQFRVNVREPASDQGRTSRVYFYLADPPEDQEVLRYRYVVDGLWMADPRNGRTQLDQNGIPVSVFDLPQQREADHSNPIVTDSGRVRFRLRLPPDASPGVRTVQGRITYLVDTRDLRVYVAGSFNNWDPYMYRLHRVQGSPGVYETGPVELTRGAHRYYFVINGRRILDPHNPQRNYHRDGYQVSVFTLSGSSTNNDL